MNGSGTNSTQERGESVADLHQRTEKMADEKRYIIYYTFAAKNSQPAPEEASADV